MTPQWVTRDLGCAPHWRVALFLNGLWGEPQDIIDSCIAFAETHGDVALMNGLRAALRAPTPHGVTFNRALVIQMLTRLESAYWEPAA